MKRFTKTITVLIAIITCFTITTSYACWKALTYNSRVQDGNVTLEISDTNPDTIIECNLNYYNTGPMYYTYDKTEYMNRLSKMSDSLKKDIIALTDVNAKLHNYLLKECYPNACYKYDHCGHDHGDPANGLANAKGTFYQDYVYEYWRIENAIYTFVNGHGVPEIENFFANEGISVIPTTVTIPGMTSAVVTPTPTPVPATPQKAIDRINAIKNSTDVENTLLVINTDGILTLAVNGEIVQFPDTQPFIDANGRTQIPIRALAETFNCNVNWDDRIKTAIINGNNKLITIAINSDVITVNGIDTTMDTTAILKDERTCVPIRYIAEALGLTVKYEKV